MPKAMEEALRKQANEHKGWSRERKNAYIFGTMYKAGWRKGKKKDLKKLS